MYPEVRLALVLLGIALAAFPAWQARRIVSRNLTALSWKRMEGVVTAMAADDFVEVELRGEPDTPRGNVPVDHHLGISFLKHVTVYSDPTDPHKMRLGGLFQMWLWPAGLVTAALLMLSGAGWAAAAGRHPVEAAAAAGRWTFSPPPAQLETEIRIHRPASEWKAPLFWSLLGITAFLCSVFVRGGTAIQHMGLGSAGVLMTLLMWALALSNKTTEISADRSGIRETTAFGWRQLPWDQVGAVEEQEAIFGRGASLLRSGSSTSFPGRRTTAIVFADKRGRTLIRMSQSMQPARTVGRLFDLCAERTGLQLKFRTIYERNL